MGKWITSGSVLTYSPWKQGTDDPNKPPPGMEHKAGEPHAAEDGHHYATWLVKVEVRLANSPFGHLIGAGEDPNTVISVVWQQIVDWSNPLD